MSASSEGSLVRLHKCAGLSEPWLFADVIPKRHVQSHSVSFDV